MENKRIEQVDQIKGTAILLVVIGHLISGFYKDHYLDSPVLNVIVAFWMALFVFISGFVAYRADYGSFTGLIRKKVPALLLPCISVGFLYALWKGVSPEFLFFSNLKYGYWFTLVLLEMYLLFYGVNRLSARLNGKKNIFTDLIVYLLPYPFLVGVFLLVDSDWAELLSWKELIRLYIYFVLGALMRKYGSVFDFLLGKNSFYSLCLVFFSASVPFIRYGPAGSVKAFAEDLLFRIPVALSAIGAIWYLFKHNPPAPRVASALSQLGKRTLDIYLLHFFFLPDLWPVVKPFLGKYNLICEITLVVLLAVPVVGMCLLLSKIIRSSDFLAFVLFGLRPRNTTIFLETRSSEQKKG